MKYIKKCDHSHNDIKFFESISSSDAWDHIDKDIKEKLNEILKAEQHNKCAYCEKKLVTIRNTNDKTFCHIDHIKSRSRYKNETYKYDNVVVSCGHDYNNEKENKNKHCGCIKRNYDIKDGFISPLSLDCSSYFKYRMNGKISSAYENKPHIQATINCLNLNAVSLVECRKAIISNFDYKEIPELMDELNNLKDSEPFYNCIKYVLLINIAGLQSKV